VSLCLTWMISGKGRLALRWTVLQFSEMEVLFHCNFQILAFHYFLKLFSTAVLVLNDSVLF